LLPLLLRLLHVVLLLLRLLPPWLWGPWTRQILHCLLNQAAPIP
jgi:hypothetical protein